jgi:general secretion pathway protein K
MWVIMVLSLLISGFAFRMSVETQVASFSRKELKAEMLARSGIEVARMELVLHTKSPEGGYEALNQEWVTNEDFYVDHELGDGKFNVKVSDEESKLPINLMTQAQLKRLMDLLGVDPSDGDVIVDSILDWREAGDLTRLNGAKTDYYQKLVPPYRSKGGPLDRVQELLMVRGVTPDIYNGTPGDQDETGLPGLKDLFTTMSSGQINVNTASSLVLETMLDVDDQRVAAVMTRRNGSDGIPGTEDDEPFHTTSDFFATIGAVNGAGQQSVSVNSSFFTVKSTGEVGGVKRTIVATLRRNGDKMETVAWNEVRGGL